MTAETSQQQSLDALGAAATAPPPRSSFITVQQREGGRVHSGMCTKEDKRWTCERREMWNGEEWKRGGPHLLKVHGPKEFARDNMHENKRVAHGRISGKCYKMRAAGREEGIRF
ncbi:hypothetical protein VIGAN_UM069700 [Vigna angularis var. angularis]|uniref:Uncharacterized protein n=1 Tax=Vigna angularis var. angularis TaxID=157739 RepID=A0A0S3TE99_PHAAN|nr:hypothetical protein VIGAN_UM069700 [Vigna angularis var. angularis]